MFREGVPASNRNMFADRLKPSIKNQFDVTDTFLRTYFANRVFSIEGMPGTVEAGHLNYIAVGMLAAHYGYDKATMYGLVVAHNAEDMYKGHTLRDLKDIEPGAKFAYLGMDYYNGKTALFQLQRLREDLQNDFCK